jgi:DNA-binding MarR family transcriptional regulator
MQDEPMPETTGALLSQICRLMRTRMHTLWDEIGLYRGQPFVLHTLWEQEGITHSELASRMHVSPPTVTNTIKRMEKAGFVERRPDMEDERVSRVYLTDAGRAIRERVEKVWRELDTTTLARFDPEERILFRRFLLLVRDNMLGLIDVETR